MFLDRMGYCRTSRIAPYYDGELNTQIRSNKSARAQTQRPSEQW